MTEDEFRNGMVGVAGRAHRGNITKSIDDVTAVAADPGNAHSDHYMRGMANGLLLAQSIVHGREPVYIEADKVAPPFDYMAECDRTVTNTPFNTMYIHRNGFVDMLKSVALLAEEMNLHKKLLFRGKLPKELGLEHPALSESLAVEFDPNNTSPDVVNVVHGIVGVITEAGEMAEVLIDMIETGKVDPVNAMEEAGDASWYVVRILRGLNTSVEIMQRMNIDKLRNRHGEAFNQFRDSNRDLVAEHERLAKFVEAEPKRGPLFSDDDNPPEKNLVTDARADRSGLGPCEGTHIHAQPMREPGQPQAVWEGGCWRFPKTPIGDVEGMDC